MNVFHNEGNSRCGKKVPLQSAWPETKLSFDPFPWRNAEKRFSSLKDGYLNWIQLFPVSHTLFVRCIWIVQVAQAFRTQGWLAPKPLNHGVIRIVGQTPRWYTPSLKLKMNSFWCHYSRGGLVLLGCNLRFVPFFNKIRWGEIVDYFFLSCGGCLKWWLIVKRRKDADFWKQVSGFAT